MHIERLEQRIQWSATPLEAQGLPDPSFGISGDVQLEVSDQDTAQAIVVQGDGKVVVAGWSGPRRSPSDAASETADFISLVRLKTDGTLDPTFGNAGILKLPTSSAFALGTNMPLLLLNDGSFLVGGAGLRKVSSSGSLITSFGTNGIAGDPFQWVSSIALTSDGKIVTMGGGFEFQRFNANGTLDTTFGTNGSTSVYGQIIDVRGSRQMAIQPDGKIVASGYAQFGSDPAWRMLLVRLTAGGAVDTTFSGDGIVYTGTRAQSLEGRAVELTPDGKILVAGISNNGVCLAEFFVDGSLDSSFGTNGVVPDIPLGHSDDAFDIAIDADGKIVVAGISDFGAMGVARFNPDGTFDTTFAGDGVASSGAIPTGISQVSRAVAIGPDGAIFFVGQVALGNASSDPEPYQNLADFFVTSVTGGAGPADAPTAMANPVPRPDAQLNAHGLLTVTTAAGDDHITIDITGGNVRVNRNGTITTYPQANVLGIDIQSGDGNDTITANVNIPETVDAGDGNDTIITGDTADNIAAGAGADSISSNGGEDVIDADTGNNTVNGGAGDDEIDATGGNDSLTGGGGRDNIRAGEGTNFIQLDGGSVTTSYQSTNTILGGDDGVSIYGSNSGADSIVTGDGDDIIYSSHGAATISSGGGNDSIGTSGDVSLGVGAIIDAGAGDDQGFCLFAHTILGGAGDDRLAAVVVARMEGGDGDDTLRVVGGNEHPALVFGGNGNDKLYSGDGPDSLYGEAGRDTLHAGGGNDRLSGGSGKDLLFGQDGDDRIYAGGGNDRLEGHAGNDRLYGAAGADLIRGGDGIDGAPQGDPLDELLDVENTLT